MTKASPREFTRLVAGLVAGLLAVVVPPTVGSAAPPPPTPTAGLATDLVRVPPSLEPILGSLLTAVADNTSRQPDLDGALVRATRRVEDASSVRPWDLDVRVRTSVPLPGGLLDGVPGSAPLVSPASDVSLSARWTLLDPSRRLEIEDARARLATVELDGALRVRSAMREAAWAAWTAHDLRRRIAWIESSEGAGAPVPPELATWVTDVRAWATSMAFEVARIDAYLAHVTGVPGGDEGLHAPWTNVDWVTFLDTAPTQPCVHGDDDVLRARTDVAWTEHLEAGRATARDLPSLEAGVHASASPSIDASSIDPHAQIGGWIRVRPPPSWGVRSDVQVDTTTLGLDVDLSWSPGLPASSTRIDEDSWDVASARAVLASATFHASERALRSAHAVHEAGPLATAHVDLPDVRAVDAWADLHASWPSFAVHAQAVDVRLQWAFACLVGDAGATPTP